jgi:hypothetical protein
MTSKEGTESFYISDSMLGLGVFAARNISRGEHLYKFTGDPVSYDQCVSMGNNEPYALQIAAKKYIVLESPGKFINHSCEPNCGITNDLLLVALKHISRGEQLFYDYSTTMLERHWVMACKCGTQTCRGVVRDFDLIPVQLQSKYISQGIVQEFIVESLKANGILPAKGKRKRKSP